jgi:thiamine pyrophosphokinase
MTKNKSALILANGKPPSKRLFLKYFKLADLFICADGGANIAARFHCHPHLIIGDFDSITKKTLRKFRSSEIRRRNDQNSTDLEKAFTAALQNKCSTIVVLGATNGRLDHAIGNLSALAKFAHRAAISFVDDSCEIIPVVRAVNFDIPVGTTISLVPLSRCTGIVTKGLRWNLKNESLQLGIRESTSNIVLSPPVGIKVRKGNLAVFIMKPMASSTTR